MGQKEKNFCCITGRVLSGREGFPLFRSSLEPWRPDEGGLIWAGTETGAAQPTLPRPSAVWICVNISASTLIRGATASPPLRTFELWPQWYLRKARMQCWGLSPVSLLLDSCWTFKVEEDQNSCIFLFSLWMQTHKRAPKNTKPAQTQQRRPDASCDLPSSAAKWEECLKQKRFYLKFHSVIVDVAHKRNVHAWIRDPIRIGPLLFTHFLVLGCIDNLWVLSPMRNVFAQRHAGHFDDQRCSMWFN